MNWLELVPEDERVCVNCAYWTNDDGRCDKCCNGGLGKVDFENMFAPGEMIIDELKECKNCAHYGMEEWSLCNTCKRQPYKDDNWEERT